MRISLKSLPRKICRGVFYRTRNWIYRRIESGFAKRLKFSHVTWYASGNAGDVVLSQCVRREFENNTGDLGWNLISVNRSVTARTIRNINKTKALIIGGGGLFLPDTNANEISGWEWAIGKELLARITVPVIIYTVGYNYFPGQLPSDLFRKNLTALCEKANFIGLRNHGSVNTIKALLPANLAQKVVYQPCTTTVIRKIYDDQLPTKKDTGKIAVNMAFDRVERRFGCHVDEICTEIAQAAKELQNRGYAISVVAHCGADSRILPYMNACGVKVHFVDLSRSFPMKVYRFYNEMDCVLGMRGHAQMIPFGLNCEILSLGTHDKMRWFLEDINAMDWYVDLSKNRGRLVEIILEKFHMIHEVNRSATREKLLDAQEKLWKITRENMEIISNIINVRG